MPIEILRQSQAAQLHVAFGPLGAGLAGMGDLTGEFGSGQGQFSLIEELSKLPQICISSRRVRSARSALVEACRRNGAAPARTGWCTPVS